MSLSRSSLFLSLLGVVLLAASVGAAVWFLRNPHANAEPPSAESPAAGAPLAVCFGRVDVESGVVSLYPVQPGRVESVRVKEGESVRKGSVLLTLDHKLADLLVEQARQDWLAAQAQLEQARKLGEQQRLREEQQQAAVDAARARARAAELVAARKRELMKAGELKEKEVQAAEALADEAKAGIRAEEKKLEELRLNNPGPGGQFIDVRRAEADAAAKKARLDQALLSLTECELKAPMDGTVLRVLANKGDLLAAQPRQPAVLLAPAEDLIIRAEVEQEVASRVRPGQAAVIEDDANVRFEWRGTVARLSDWYAQRRSILLEPGQLNDVRTLEAIIRLDSSQPPDPQRPPLRIGQRVRVIVLDKE